MTIVKLAIWTSKNRRARNELIPYALVQWQAHVRKRRKGIHGHTTSAQKIQHLTGCFSTVHALQTNLMPQKRLFFDLAQSVHLLSMVLEQELNPIAKKNILPLGLLTK